MRAYIAVISASLAGCVIESVEPAGETQSSSLTANVCHVEEAGFGTETATCADPAPQPTCVADRGDCFVATMPACNLATSTVDCPGTGACNTRTVTRWSATACRLYGWDYCERTGRVAQNCRMVGRDCMEPNYQSCIEATPPGCALPAGQPRSYCGPTNPDGTIEWTCANRWRWSDTGCQKQFYNYACVEQAGGNAVLTCRNP